MVKKIALFTMVAVTVSVFFSTALSATELSEQLEESWSEVTEYFSIYRKFVWDNDFDTPSKVIATIHVPSLYRKNKGTVFDSWDAFEKSVKQYTTGKLQSQMLYNDKIVRIDDEIWNHDTEEVLDHLVYASYGLHQYKGIVKTMREGDTAYAVMKVITDAGEERFLIHIWKYSDDFDKWLLAQADELYFGVETNLSIGTASETFCAVSDIIFEYISISNFINSYYEEYGLGVLDTVVVDGVEYILTRSSYDSLQLRLSNILAPELVLSYMAGNGIISYSEDRMLAIRVTDKITNCNIEDPNVTWKVTDIKDGFAACVISLPVYDKEGKLTVISDHEISIEIDSFFEGKVISYDSNDSIPAVIPDTHDKSCIYLCGICVSSFMLLAIIKRRKDNKI